MRKGDDLTTFKVPKVMKNPEGLTFRIRKGLFRPVAGEFYLLLDGITFRKDGAQKIVRSSQLQTRKVPFVQRLYEFFDAE